MDLKRIQQILNQNKEKGFVQRILKPGDYPTLINPGGTESTHSMAWTESEGRYFVFPTVLYDGQSGLARYDIEDAWQQTQKTGNYIEFDTAEEADVFSREYKKYWKRE